MPPHISSYELSERATTRATSRMKGHVKSAKSPKQPTPDIRSMFAPSTSRSQGGIALSKQQQLQVRLEGRRQSFTNERDAAIEAKRIKVAAEESEFEANGWRRAWDKANATKMAAREVKRREHVLKMRAEEEAVNARALPNSFFAKEEVPLVSGTGKSFLSGPSGIGKSFAFDAHQGVTAIKRSHINWARDHPLAKQPALALCKKLKGGYHATVAQLQANEWMNADGIFNHLSPGTLRDWYLKSEEGLTEPPKEKVLPPHMVCPLDPSVLQVLEKELIAFGEEGATLNSASIYVIFIEIIERLQPEVLDPSVCPTGKGTFKLKLTWINDFCRDKGFSMQRKTTTSHKLPSIWKELGKKMNLRLAHMIFFNVSKELMAFLDETPVKGVPNSGEVTRHKKGSGGVFGLGKDNKMQETTTLVMTATGIFGALSD